MENKLIIPDGGKYVVAVSGGVDSMALLHLISKNKNTNIIVAHFDHGIRLDSNEDLQLVKEISENYGFIFESEQGNLGSQASEATARSARYNFLNKVKIKHGANAIITAHHQDDIIETCFINILRGTGRRGITSLTSTAVVFRPLIGISKKHIIDYAVQNNLKWREDITNNDPKYLRNNLRINILNNFNNEDRARTLKIIEDTRFLNEKIDKEIEILLRQGLHKNQTVLNRSWFSKLPHDISKEVILAILSKLQAGEIDRKSIEKIVISVKTLPAGKTIQVSGLSILLTKRSARFVKSVAKQAK
jgi:tRNA(Ile)-lysidine synthase